MAAAMIICDFLRKIVLLEYLTTIIMKNKTIYRPGCLGHIYQRGHKGFVMFYNVKDSIVFFTIFMLAAKRYGIRISGLCLMYNHYHVDFEADDARIVSKFISAYCSMYSKAFNSRYGFSGKVFDRYGISNKRSDKERRTAYSYLYNNPVEWHLCPRAEEYQMNFLKYAVEDHPFSEKTVSRNMSRGFRRAVEKVRYLHSHERPILYKTIDRLMDGLNMKEKRQLADIIFKIYSRIDFDRAISYYGSFEKMTNAFGDNTGSEYDINEEFDQMAGNEYKKMAHYLAQDKRYDNLGDLVKSPAENRISYLWELVITCHVTVEHARRFLHINASGATDYET